MNGSCNGELRYLGDVKGQDGEAFALLSSEALASVEKHLARVEQSVGSIGYIAKTPIEDKELVKIVAKLSNFHCIHILTANTSFWRGRGGSWRCFWCREKGMKLWLFLGPVEGQFGEMVEVMRKLVREFIKQFGFERLKTI